jgi:hypothetical protein
MAILCGGEAFVCFCAGHIFPLPPLPFYMTPFILRITDVQEFVHRPRLNKLQYTTFRKLELLASSSLGVLQRSSLSHWSD